MDTDTTPHCPLPNIGLCVGERCNFWDEEAGCTGVGITFAADPTLEWLNYAGDNQEDQE